MYILLMGSGLALQSGTESRPFAPPNASGGPQEFLVPLLLTSWVAVGALLTSRQPKHPIGWLFSAIPLLFAIDEFAFGYAYFGSITYPGSLPFVEVAIVWLYWSGRAVGATLVTLLFLWFPTGKPMSKRWGALAWISLSATLLFVLAALVAPLPINNLPFPTDISGAGREVQELVLPITWATYSSIIFCTFLAIFSLYWRLHRAADVERQQLKWFAFASAFFVPGILLIILGLVPGTPLPDWLFPLGVILVVGMFTGIAIASAIAILRYRLWDIDIIIRRTLIYGILTGLLALVYFSSIILLTNLLSAIGRQPTAIVTVISTLVIAAAFSPLRRGVQDAIDRRFYRRQNDTAKILARFSASVQTEVELTSLMNELLTVVDKSLQPASISLWLRED